MSDKDLTFPFLPPSSVAYAIMQDLIFKLTGQRTDTRNAEPLVVEVSVAGDYSDDNDVEVAGVYLMELDPDVPSHKIADAALDSLHHILQVKKPEDFCFTVIHQNRVLDNDPSHIEGTLSQNAVLVNKVLG